MRTTQRHVRLTDTETGQELDFRLPERRKPKAALTKGGFAMLTQSDRLQQIIDAKPGAETYATLLALLRHLDYEGTITATQGQIAEAARVPQNNIARALLALHRLEVIAREPKQGRYATIRLNPRIAWKGSPQNYQKAITQFDAAHEAEAQRRAQR